MGWVGLDSVQLRSLRLNREINMRAAHFIKIHIHLFIVAKRVNSFITAAALNQIRAFHSHFAAIYELQNEKWTKVNARTLLYQVIFFFCVVVVVVAASMPPHFKWYHRHFFGVSFHYTNAKANMRACMCFESVLCFSTNKIWQLMVCAHNNNIKR